MDWLFIKDFLIISLINFIELVKQSPYNYVYKLDKTSYRFSFELITMESE